MKGFMITSEWLEITYPHMRPAVRDELAQWLVGSTVENSHAARQRVSDWLNGYHRGEHAGALESVES